MSLRAVRAAVLLLALAVSAVARPSHAAGDFQTRSAARLSATEGFKLYDAGKFAEALDKFQRANKLVPAPTLQVRIARCFEKLGRLVDASEMYLEASLFRSEPGAPPAYAQAKKEAQSERDLLASRIPKLRVLVTGPLTDNSVVLLNGKPLQLELLDNLVPVDPGRLEVRVRREDVTVTRATNVSEGATARIEVPLPELPHVRKARVDARVARWHTGIVSAFAVGGAGVLAFAINGSIALAQRGDLDERCPAANCPPDAFAELSAYEATRVATTVGLVMGGVGLAAGTTLVLLRPKAAPLPNPVSDAAAQPFDRVEAYLGPFGAGLRASW